MARNVRKVYHLLGDYRSLVLDCEDSNLLMSYDTFVCEVKKSSRDIILSPKWNTSRHTCQSIISFLHSLGFCIGCKKDLDKRIDLNSNINIREISI